MYYKTTFNIFFFELYNHVALHSFLNLNFPTEYLTLLKNIFYSQRLYFRISLRLHGHAKVKSSPKISNERIIEQNMTNCYNKV